MYRNLFILNEFIDYLFLPQLSALLLSFRVCELFRKMSPCGCHFWNSLVSEFKMMALLIILHFPSAEHRISIISVISKFAFCCCFETWWINTKFVMSSYLIQSILISEKLVLAKAFHIFLFIKLLNFFCLEIYAPASWMIPVRLFKLINFIFT